MRTIKKIVVTLLSLAMLMSMLCVGASAAVSGKAGQSVTVTLSIANSYGMHGSFNISNTGIFESYTVTSNLPGDINNNMVFVFGTEKITVKLTLTGTLKSSAKEGDTCVFSFSGKRVVNDDGKEEAVSATETLTVAAKETTTTPVTTAPPVDEPTPGPTPGTPTTPANKIDYTELNRQIDIANALKKDGYTDASWDAMIVALGEARNLRTSYSQAAVDAGAKKLADAIAALQKIDYAALKAAVDKAIKFNTEDEKEIYELWNAYAAAYENANNMLTSGDQAAVDKAAADLESALSALSEKLESMGSTVVKEVEKEVIKEVEPQGDFCNIRMHRVWLILLIISAVLNVGFIVLIVLWFLKKKNNTKDDTPLVNYDIGDDD